VLLPIDNVRTEDLGRREGAKSRPRDTKSFLQFFICFYHRRAPRKSIPDNSGVPTLLHINLQVFTWLPKNKGFLYTFYNYVVETGTTTRGLFNVLTINFSRCVSIPARGRIYLEQWNFIWRNYRRPTRNNGTSSEHPFGASTSCKRKKLRRFGNFRRARSTGPYRLKGVQGSN
jgi:hypothetical protein